MAVIRTKLDLNDPPPLTAEEREELARLDEMRDEDIDTSDIPELGARFWSEGERGSDPTPGRQSGSARFAFEIQRDASGVYQVNFMRDGEVIFASTARYRSRSEAEESIETIKRHVSAARIVAAE